MKADNPRAKRLGRRIAKARAAVGLSQAELGRRIKKSRSTVHGWENGDHAPRTIDLPDIARTIGIDVSDLTDDLGAA